MSSSWPLRRSQWSSLFPGSFFKFWELDKSPAIAVDAALFVGFSSSWSRLVDARSAFLFIFLFLMTCGFFWDWCAGTFWNWHPRDFLVHGAVEKLAGSFVLQEFLYRGAACWNAGCCREIWLRFPCCVREWGRLSGCCNVSISGLAHFR